MKPFGAFMLSLAVGIALFIISAVCGAQIFSLLGLFFGINLTMGACIIHTINKNFSDLRKDLKDQSKKDE